MSHANALERASAHAKVFLSSLDTRSVAPTKSLADLRSALSVPLDDGVSAEIVIDELVAATEGGHLASPSGRFFAWVIGGALPAALAADWLASTWDANATLFACGPAAAVVEEVAGAWIKDILGLPEEASFGFTTGCQMAHVTALAAARHALLRDRGWDVEGSGLFGAPAITILANDQRHGSIERALRYLGIGTSALRPLQSDPDGRISVSALTGALAETTGPCILILNAGDLNIGAMDDFVTLIPLAKAAGAWVHVDGAFGLWGRASSRYSAQLRGVEAADSWATDAHKWLNTPQDCGVAVVRDRRAHRAAMTVDASYLSREENGRDAIDWTPDWTRRARGYSVYAALRELGRPGLAELIDRCCLYSAELARGISMLPGAELVAAPTLNQGLVRFLAPGTSDEAEHDRRTDEIIAAVNRTGEAFFSGTTWRGRRAMRISVVNWRTTEDDVLRTKRIFEKILVDERL